VIEALLASSAIVAGIVDPDPAWEGRTLLGVPVLGGDDVVLQYPRNEVRLANGIGSVGLPQKRMEVFERFEAMGFAFTLVIHPSAVVASDAEIGNGTQIMAGAVIQPGSRIGCNAIVNTKASVDHDCIIGDHVHLAPGVTLSGGVTVGAGTHIGTGATVIQGVRIGCNSLIGAGALVLRDVLEGLTVVGNPAKVVAR
jgi:sugar O-acyltransferase (sialic acid O-acetyltransferase NeuD family)